MKYIITESQRHTLLMETVSPKIRRRLGFENMVEEMESIIEYQLEPCSFKTASAFVAEACDMFVYDLLEDTKAKMKVRETFLKSLTEQVATMDGEIINPPSITYGAQNVALSLK
jgi:hypothetical protein